MVLDIVDLPYRENQMGMVLGKDSRDVVGENVWSLVFIRTHVAKIYVYIYIYI